MMLLHRRHLKISFSLKWANDEFFWKFIKKMYKFENIKVH